MIEQSKNMLHFNSVTDAQEYEVATGKKLIKLEDLADKNCKKCYGRGHRGFEIKTKKFIPCVCVQKNFLREHKKNEMY